MNETAALWFCQEGDQICNQPDTCEGHGICEHGECANPEMVVIDELALCDLHSAQIHRLLTFRLLNAADDTERLALLRAHASICSVCGDA